MKSFINDENDYMLGDNLMQQLIEIVFINSRLLECCRKDKSFVQNLLNLAVGFVVGKKESVIAKLLLLVGNSAQWDLVIQAVVTLMVSGISDAVVVVNQLAGDQLMGAFWSILRRMVPDSEEYALSFLDAVIGAVDQITKSVPETECEQVQQSLIILVERLLARRDEDQDRELYQSLVLRQQQLNSERSIEMSVLSPPLT